MASDQINKINLDLLLEYAASLPVSPRIFTRLEQLAHKEDTALDYITSLVRMDPGLTARILRVTNSAFYAGSVKISEVGSAISRIGFNELKSILNHIVEHEAFYQAVPAYGVTASAFADEAIETAIIAETIAKRFGFESNAPYVSGLLHQIGKLAINLYLERMDSMADLSEAAGETPLVEFESETLGLNHFRAGAELLSNWQFEPAIWMPIRNQSSPLHAQSYLRQTCNLSLAIWMREQLKDYDPDGSLPDHIKRALKELNADALDLPALLDDSRFEINDRKNMLAMLL